MTPDQLEAELRNQELRSVYLLVGEERQLVQQAIELLKERAIEGGTPGLNDDTFVAGQAGVDEVLATARTLPMLARRRWLLVRGIEKWDAEKASKRTKGKGTDAKASPKGPLDTLLDYATEPSESTVAVFVASKLDKRRKLYTVAKKEGFLVVCDPPKRAEVPGWIVERAESKGNRISRADADLLAELLGGDLSALADAIERLSLYVGEGKPITDAAISDCVVRVKTATVWQLVSAVGDRDAARALRVLDDVYDPTDRFRLLGVLGWATRQLSKFDEARKAGATEADAAKAAGAPPFKARELASQVRSMPEGTLDRWLVHLSRADLDMKGGSKRPPRAVVERMLLDLCQAG